MAEVVEGDFTCYSFTDEELISAATFNVLQKMYLISKRAEVAGDLIRLTIDPANIQKYLQDQAYLQGQLALLDFFLNHENAEAAKQRWLDLTKSQNPQSNQQ